MRNRILIYQIGSIGDTIISLPAINATIRHFGKESHFVLLHESNPNLLTSPRNILSNLWIDEFITYENSQSFFKKAYSLFNLWRRVKLGSFDYVVYILPCERSDFAVKRDRLFFKLCNIKNLIGFYCFLQSELYPIDKNGYPMAVEREALGRLLRLENDGIDISIERKFELPLIKIPEEVGIKITDWLEKIRVRKKALLIAICPGAKQSANIWPLVNFERLGKMLVSNFDIEIIVIGSKSDSSLASYLIANWKSGIDATGLFSVIESTSLLDKCDLLIGLDTGTTHLAASVGTKCLTIFGERDNFGRWVPFGIDNEIVKAKVPCAGCRQSVCNMKEHYCMELITVDEVYNIAKKMITKLCNEKHINN
jgi:heptosyltransferase-3